MTTTNIQVLHSTRTDDAILMHHQYSCTVNCNFCLVRSIHYPQRRVLTHP